MSLKDTIRTKLNKFLIANEPVKTTEFQSNKDGNSLSGSTGQLVQSYYNSMKLDTKRIGRYYEYNYLDKNLAEATSTLNIYADNIVSGAMGEKRIFMWLLMKRLQGLIRLSKL